MYNKEFEVGEMVMFPSDRDNYQMKQGLLLGFHDNPSDVEQLLYENPPSYCKDGPRQVANILYNGKHMTCWKHSLQDIGVQYQRRTADERR